MRTKFSGILTLLLAFVVQLTFAQEKTISGNVTDNSGVPLLGVNIIVKGTNNGTQTDFDGNYTITANVGQTLEFSYVGFKNVDMPVTASTSTINVQMEEAADALETVIVTAQGIKKEKKALGYSVTSISEEQIQSNPESDLTRVLQGKAAGVSITTQSGMSGSANKVIIRGMMSFSSDNNALYIVDGIPYSNDTNAAGDFVDGNMGTSRSFDIDPNNIESVEVLKGLAATTLYGSDGRNGVIIITTKTGSTKGLKSKQEIQISSSYFFNKIASLPDYQDKFGGGFDQSFGWFFSNWGPGFYKDGLGGWGSDSAFDADGTLPHPYSVSSFLSANYPDYQAQFAGQRYEWKPRNSVEDFFRTGAIASIAGNIRGRSKDGDLTYGVAFSHLDDEGFTPGNNVERNNLTVSGTANLTNKFRVRGSMTYTKTRMKTPPVAFSNGSGASTVSIFGDILYTPRSVDFFELPYELPDGGSIYYRNGNDIQHPLWTLNHSKFSQSVFRVNGYAALDYDLTDHLSVGYQGSVDQYSEDNVNQQDKGGVGGTNRIRSGFYETWNNNNLITEHRVILTGKNYNLTDEIGFDFNVGATTKGTRYNRIGLASDGQEVFGFFDHSGFINRQEIEFHNRRNLAGVFGQMSFSLGSYLYLNVAGRNDWVSNAKDNSLFYPSASLSFIPTSLFENLKSDMVNNLKLRVGFGTSAHFADGYPNFRGVNLNTSGWIDANGDLVTTNANDNTLPNLNIKPELLEELEFGVEATLFKRRVRLDASYYTRTTTDLIVNSPVPTSTGYTTTPTNIGQIDADGIEASADIKILDNADGFNWNFGVNFTTNDSEVVDLGSDNDLIIYAGFTNLGNGARVGYPLGTIFGSRVARDANGNLVVGSDGNYLTETSDEEGILPAIGNPNPDFVMNYTNTFSYKGFSLSMQINHTSGGDIYSTTIATLLGRGLTTDTEDRLGTYILPGVDANGNPNTTQINNSDYYFGNLFTGPDELQVYDGSVIRLQEIALSYNLPKKLLEKTPFGSVSLKVSGNNLWYDAYNTPDGINFDPNTSALGAGNGQGFDFLTGPTSKRYGMSINVTF
jgi:TonB-linked SusC/RagA family outer membrane protein